MENNYDYAVFDYSDGKPVGRLSKNKAKLIDSKAVKLFITKQLGNGSYHIAIRRVGHDYYRFLVPDNKHEKILICGIADSGQYARINEAQMQELIDNVFLSDNVLEIKQVPLSVEGQLTLF